MKFEDPRSMPSYQLWLASNAWQREIRKALCPLGLTHTQFAILASIDVLGREQEQVSQIDVCRFLAIDENMTSQVVRTLILKKFVTREPHPTDGRATVLTLTDPGRSILAQGRGRVKPALAEFFSPLGSKQKDLVDLLQQLNAGWLEPAEAERRPA